MPALPIYEYRGYTVVLRMISITDTQFHCTFTIYSGKNAAFISRPAIAHLESGSSSRPFSSRVAAEAAAVAVANTWIDANPLD
jgi:hypothetical protein